MTMMKMETEMKIKSTIEKKNETNEQYLPLHILEMKQAAEEAFLNGDVDKSLETWKMLLPYAKQIPHLYAAYAVLLCFGFNKFEEAESYLLKALELEPHNIIAQRHLGNVYMEWHKYDKAVLQFEKIIGVYNNQHIETFQGIPLINRDEINYNYAYALEQCEQYSQAVEYYRLAVENREKEYLEFVKEKEAKKQAKGSMQSKDTFADDVVDITTHASHNNHNNNNNSGGNSDSNNDKSNNTNKSNNNNNNNNKNEVNTNPSTSTNSQKK
ncbi:hypothetical protein RFI_12372 [Reticulomyxa filosa]|uniref:TPR repeat-containing protein n=1 Tax=Reticulomyxa filosa TaxID=46433 RepID=X6NFW6_RETFI|nr:hypothetical protein RFI_12372 [Reticulomyxa filosa]|eukprot:ETO24788.1 hypothetical protein RFI_12372 [Reticulomyxa filosa]